MENAESELDRTCIYILMVIFEFRSFECVVVSYDSIQAHDCIDFCPYVSHLVLWLLS